MMVLGLCIRRVVQSNSSRPKKCKTRTSTEPKIIQMTQNSLLMNLQIHHYKYMTNIKAANLHILLPKLNKSSISHSSSQPSGSTVTHTHTHQALRTNALTQTFSKLRGCPSPCLIGEVWGGGQCRDTMLALWPSEEVRWGCDWGGE